MKSYTQWADYLGKKNERPCGNNTRVRFVTETVGNAKGNAHINRGVAIRLHATDVVTLWEDGRIVLNSGGYRTNTTRDRINEHSPVRVRQHKGVWSFERGGVSHLFADGVTLHPDGSVTGAAEPSAKDNEAKLRKSILKFAKLCGNQQFPIPRPGPGDCMFCQFNRQQTGFGTEHFISHMDEGYVVPSLVWNALEFAGYDPAHQIAHAAVFNAGVGMKEFARDAVRRSVRKFMLRQFGMA